MLYFAAYWKTTNGKEHEQIIPGTSVDQVETVVKCSRGCHPDTVHVTLISTPERKTPEPDYDEISVVFDGPPGPDGPRFVEVEDLEGKSINVGEWHGPRDDGNYELRLKVIR